MMKHFMQFCAPSRLYFSLAIFVAVLLLFASQLLYTNLEGDFLPEEDKGRLFCFVIAPEGSTSEYTDRMLKQMEQILSETPEVEIYGSLVAPGF